MDEQIDNSMNEEQLDKLYAPEVTGDEPDHLVEPVPDQAADSSSGTGALFIGIALAIAFVVGLALGFFGRPVIIEDLPIEVVVTVVPDRASAGSDTAQTAPQENSTDGAEDGSSPTIMDMVLSDARHFQGTEAAPVTMVEFADFN